jgi:glycosyltransferase involved in cell wall biosynthesis
VIHHGFDAELFSQKIDKETQKRFRAKYLIDDAPYLLYVGAIQPRKNLVTLIEAFGKLKETGNYPKLKLVLAGAPAWQAEGTLEAVQNSHYSKEIILTGRVSFSDLAKFYQCADVFIFPSLYEGFGIPILESFASGTPVICANNSSLPEVAGNAALYFTSGDVAELETKIKEILENAPLKENLIKKGYLRLEEFSWEKCAEESLEFIKI